MLAGISQTVFLKQWGEPETQIGLSRLGSLNKLGALLLVADNADEVHHSIWIYKKKDSVLFFTRKRLVSHYKWSEFRERCKRPKEKTGSKSAGKCSSFSVTTLALVA
jgi:hypothetical protein